MRNGGQRIGPQAFDGRGIHAPHYRETGPVSSDKSLQPKARKTVAAPGPPAYPLAATLMPEGIKLSPAFVDAGLFSAPAIRRPSGRSRGGMPPCERNERAYAPSNLFLNSDLISLASSIRPTT